MQTHTLREPVDLNAQLKDRADPLGARTVVAVPFASDQWLRHGFFAAIAISVSGFVAVFAYLSFYAYETNAWFSKDSIAVLRTLADTQIKDILFIHLAAWQFALQACGMMAGVVLGFLGLALFLLGISGDMTGKGTALGHSVQINHLAPGTLVILASTMLIGICATHKSELQVRPSSVAADNQNASATTNPPLGSSQSNPAPSDKTQTVGPPASICIPDPTINKTCAVKAETSK